MKNLFCLLFSLLQVGVFAQWNIVPSGTVNNLKSVFFTSADTGYAVGYSGTIIKTIDEGMTWSTLSSGTTEDLNSVFFTSSLTGYAAGNFGTLIKTSDGGASWDSLSCGTANSLRSVFFIDADTGYVAGDFGTILKTTNRGALWTIWTEASGKNFYTVYFVNAANGYTAGNYYVHPYASTDGTILRTNNYANSWTNTDFDDGFNSLYFTSRDTGYAVGYYIHYFGAGHYDVGSIILKTTNGGTGWMTQASPDSNFLNSVYFTDANNGYAVGSAGTLIKTTNGGDYWAKQSSGTSMGLNSVRFTNDSTGYIAGDNGIILKTTNGGGFFVGLPSPSSKSNTLSICPNPAKDEVTIETAAGRNNSRLSILNPCGQELFSLRVQGCRTLVDISALPPGVYFVTVTDDLSVDIGKFVKQ
ncbi:MAG: YCF48-related protein [Bacteroidetes bacterium]|nr:YCF48-related protein [Bacteroidota bacterium]